ncbi:MAG: HAD-IIIA family hydrolase [Psychrobium sp.]|nr:HAD-IIIA family hydrolase [Psychrobium sp.]
MSYQLAIFDWDGTIMDSVGRIVSCMRGAAKRAGLAIPSEQAVKDIIGLSLQPAFEQLFPGISESDSEAMREFYRQEYVANDGTPTPVFEDIEHVLQTLSKQGIKLAVATGKARAGLERVFAASGLKHYFEDSIAADEASSKPDADMINILVKRFNIDKTKVVMIGDSQLDLTMANNAGVDAIGVSYGAHSVEVLSAKNPLAVVSKPMDILKIMSA